VLQKNKKNIMSADALDDNFFSVGSKKKRKAPELAFEIDAKPFLQKRKSNDATDHSKKIDMPALESPRHFLLSKLKQIKPELTSLEIEELCPGECILFIILLSMHSSFYQVLNN